MASGGSRHTFNYELRGSEPDYFKDAYGDLGTRESVSGGRSNPAVEKYIEDTIGKRMNAKTTPWCAFFVGSKLENNKHKSTKSGMARSYLHYGSEIEESKWKVGDIVVLWRGQHDDGVLGHIGFLASWNDSHVVLLGGNQGDEVSFQSFKKSKILSVRRPKKVTQSRTIKAAAAEAVNTGILKPVTEQLPDAKTEVLNKASSTLEQATSMVDALGEWKPYIKIALYSLSAITLLLIFYYRTQDFNEKGRV